MKNCGKKIALFIDGAKFRATARALGFEIDFKRLLEEFEDRGTLLRASYYTAIVEDLEYCAVRPLVDWLDYNGYTVITKPTKEFIDDAGRRRAKDNIDIDLAVGAMEIAEYVDEIILFSGDGNFRPLVAALQRRGIRVTIVSTIVGAPMVADELRRQADEFIDLASLEAKLGRTPPAARSSRLVNPAMLFVRQRDSSPLDDTASPAATRSVSTSPRPG
jgi:uncharacterized LabA/DUF88 family protein